MASEQRIAEMQKRIRRWLSSTPDTTECSLEGLETDVASLEAELQALFPSEKGGRAPFEILRDQSMFRTVLDSMAEGVIVTDMEGRVLIFNAAARALLGQDEKNMNPEGWVEQYGLFHADAVTPCAPEELPLARAMQGESVGVEELTIRAPGRDDVVYISATARPLQSEAGEQLGGVVVFYDITESRRVEAELREARNRAEEASRTKSEFLANMSHEIRTPMTAVLGFADLLLDPELNESNRLNYIQAIRRNGEHLLGLLNDILDLSKLQADRMNMERTRFSLHQLLHEVASAMQVRAHEKNLDFDIRYETPMPREIESDAMRIRQILLNLLSNAIKFTRQGEIVLTCRCLDPGTPSSRLELAVTDSGIGLEEGEIEQLFQPFHQANLSTTREYGGTGLGLVICRSLAEALGGEIRVDSAPGQGSTFALVLYQPIDQAAEMVDDHSLAPSELEPTPTEPVLSQKLFGRILLAEDGHDNQLLIATILERQGLEVDIATDGEEAVEKALATIDAGTPYDLVLMDMQMPRLDGYGATARLRRKDYSRPVVALTAHAMSGERERCMAAGCDDYLTKPIAPAELLAAVERYMDRIRGGEPRAAVAPGSVEETADPEEAGPIYSSYADDPDMAELVQGFVERLPVHVQDIRAAADSGDLERLRRLAHQLKGSAGGYGFQSVSQAAATLEACAREAGESSEVDDAVNQLVHIGRRVTHTEPG